jgi:pimeloyl-ACP methyl ester carboxylesterase
VLSGDIYLALGGDLPGNFSLTPMQQLAANVEGVTVPLSGHWIPAEQPGFVIDQLFKFFGNSTNERPYVPFLTDSCKFQL